MTHDIKTVSSPVLLSLRDLAMSWNRKSDKYISPRSYRSIAPSSDFIAGRREGIAEAYALCAKELLELSLGVEE